MKILKTEILVIGGGATGTGLMLDLALRGFKVILVEKGDLSHGTTGRFHGLLHSGGRYVVSDPQAAADCYHENQILRKIIPFAIEDTGGFFVSTPWDEGEYADHFINRCRVSAIPVEEIDIAQMLKREPLLNPGITRCFHVPDASVDSFLTSEANAAASRDLGAQIFTYYPVEKLLTGEGRVNGAICHDREKDEKVRIEADMVVNASGAWAGVIAKMAGIKIRMVPGKGTMLATNHRVVNTVINRCKYPSDGDIIVPAHTVAVLGTTDHPVPDPDNFSIEPWEVERIISEGEKIIPGIKDFRFLRAWAGVRPLIKEDPLPDSQQVQDSRELSRNFVLLDHKKRDNVDGFVTITCGKWTTYRKMAEVTADLVCEKLGTGRSCETPSTKLHHPFKSSTPIKAKNRYHLPGDRLRVIEKAQSYGNLICECELVTREDILNAWKGSLAKSLDDIRRDTRLGMGPCQGLYCTVRAAGILHEVNEEPVEKFNQAVVDFVTERWSGIQPVLWGQQLRQQAFDDFINHSLLKINQLHLPAFAPLKIERRSGRFTNSADSRLNLSDQGKGIRILPLQVNTESAGDKNVCQENNLPSTSEKSSKPRYDVVVIGGGLAGLSAAWRAVRSGLQTCLVTHGWGTLYWGSGCIDVFSVNHDYTMQESRTPIDGLRKVRDETSDHPYSLLEETFCREVIEDFKSIFQDNGYRLRGSLDHQYTLPTSLGTLRKTCLAPVTMLAGDIHEMNKPSLIVGFENFHDFSSKLVAHNLIMNGIQTKWCNVDVSKFTSKSKTISPTAITSTRLSYWMEKEDFRNFIIGELQHLLVNPEFRETRSIGIPAVLGNKNAQNIHNEILQKLGIPVYEIPTLPPSVPGIRLAHILVEEIRKSGGIVHEGIQILSAQTEDHRVVAVCSESAAGKRSYTAREFILATGGMIGGGIQMGYQETPREVIFNLPVTIPEVESSLSKSTTHIRSPLFNVGIKTNAQLQPLSSNGEIFLDNVTCAGTVLHGGDYVIESSVEGVGLFTGCLAGAIVSKKLQE